MKNILYCVLLASSFISISNCRVIEKTLSVYVIEEQVNGIRFTHRSDYVDGKTQELWAINGKVTTQQEYEEAILDAEKEERRVARKREEKRRKQEEEFKVVAHNNAVKKLIQLKIHEIDCALAKVKEPLLEPFLKFSELTVTSEQILSSITQQLESARNLCNTADVSSYNALQECFNALEHYPEKLSLLYQDSVNYAIKTCDDTRALKDLLVLVS